MLDIDELEEEIMQIVGHAVVLSRKRNGEIVIHTGLCEGADGTLLALDDEEEDEDVDLDEADLGDDDE